MQRNYEVRTNYARQRELLKATMQWVVNKLKKTSHNWIEILAKKNKPTQHWTVFPGGDAHLSLSLSLSLSLPLSFSLFLSLSLSNSLSLSLSPTVKEKNSVGEKVHTFPYKTFCTEFNFELSEWLDLLVLECSRGGLPLGTEKYLGMELNLYFFPIIRKLWN